MEYMPDYMNYMPGQVYGEEVEEKESNNFHEACYREYVVKKIHNDFSSLIEIYLLSLLLFLSLVLEFKSYMSENAHRLFNITTVVYFVTEFIIFVYYVGSFMKIH